MWTEIATNRLFQVQSDQNVQRLTHQTLFSFFFCLLSSFQKKLRDPKPLTEADRKGNDVDDVFPVEHCNKMSSVYSHYPPVVIMLWLIGVYVISQNQFHALSVCMCAFHVCQRAVAPNQLLQHRAQHSQPQVRPQAKLQPLAQHQQPSAGRRSHRTLPKDQTQLLSLQYDHRHREKERQRERQKETCVATAQKLTAISGNKAATAAAAAASPSRSANSQHTVVNPAFLHSLADLITSTPHIFLFIFSSLSYIAVKSVFHSTLLCSVSYHPFLLPVLIFTMLTLHDICH